MSIERGYVIYDKTNKMYYRSDGAVQGWVNHIVLATIFVTDKAAWDLVVYSPSCTNRDTLVLRVKIVLDPEEE